MLYQFRREEQTVQKRAEAVIALSTEHGFPHFLALGPILRGWALAEQGQGKEGIVQMQQGLNTYRATGAGIARTQFLALLAEAYGKAGQAEDGLAALAEALTVEDNSGERFYEAELYRLKGELTLQKLSVASSQLSVPNPQLEAEACFHEAIEIARQQQAKSLELRAVMSLSRLWQQRGKKEEAHQILSGIYGWFTEGFDTADLQEAKALIEELSH
jgi:predicted ATPase